jgi:hypothetical protein
VISRPIVKQARGPLLKEAIPEVCKLLKPGGLSIAKFEPLYSSPYGSYPRRFSAELVVHLRRSDVELW